jgi:hypothetical protein
MPDRFTDLLTAKILCNLSRENQKPPHRGLNLCLAQAMIWRQSQCLDGGEINILCVHPLLQSITAFSYEGFESREVLISDLFRHFG